MPIAYAITCKAYMCMTTCCYVLMLSERGYVAHSNIATLCTFFYIITNVEISMFIV